MEQKKPKKIPDTELKYETKEVEEEHVLGALIQEENSSQRLDEPINIPLGYKRTVIIDGNEEIAYMSIRTPADINPDFYYPVTEWRITPELLLDQDNLPQWVRRPVVVNGQTLMDVGRPLQISYYVIRAELDMPEEKDGMPYDGTFFIDPPFSRDEVKMSDIGLPMIKGSDIVLLAEANKLLSGQSTASLARQRVA